MAKRNEFRWVSPESLMQPKDFSLVEVMRDRYWIARHVNERVEILMYGDHPQCNPNRSISERVLESAVGRENGADHVLFLPLTFRTIDPRDY
jgi:hypothetical protein